jgi:glutathione S-transferase
MLELFHAGLTTCSKKVRLCLAEKGLDFRSHYLDLRKFEHHRPEYLAINPNGVVPTLVHDGEPIIESMLINEYIDAVFPDPPLRPSDPLQLARMRLWTKLADNYGLAAVVPNTWAYYQPLLSKMNATEYEQMIANVPTAERREQWRKASNNSFSSEDHGKARAAATRIVDAIEVGIGEGPWLMGDAYSLADVDLLPYVDRIALYFPDVLGAESGQPRTLAWLASMLERPAVKATYKPSAEAPASVVPVAKQA